MRKVMTDAEIKEAHDLAKMLTNILKEMPHKCENCCEVECADEWKTRRQQQKAYMRNNSCKHFIPQLLWDRNHFILARALGKCLDEAQANEEGAKDG